MASAGQHDPRVSSRNTRLLSMTPAPRTFWKQYQVTAAVRSTEEPRHTRQGRHTALRRGCSPARREPMLAAGRPSPGMAHGSAPGPGAAIPTWPVSPPLLTHGETHRQQD